MTTPISVIVVNHNGRAVLDRCLASVVAEGPDEVLLVDSGSDDGAEVEAASRHGARLLRLDGNLGPGSARNLGFREARNELVAFVDCDVEVLPGCLARLRAALEAEPGRALVQARSLLRGNGDDPAEAVVHYDGASLHYVGLMLLRNFYVPAESLGPPAVVDVDCLQSLCCLGRRSELLAVGGFDEPYFYLMEDLALSYALRMTGRRLALVEDALCWHGAGSAGLSTRGDRLRLPPRRIELQSRNRWLFLLTSYRLRTLVLIAPALVAYGLVHLAFVTVSGQLPAFVRGKLGVLKRLAWVRRRRRILQGMRVVGDRELLRGGRPTFHPGLADRGLRHVVRRALQGFLRTARWRLVRGRWMAGRAGRTGCRCARRRGGDLPAVLCVPSTTGPTSTRARPSPPSPASRRLAPRVLVLDNGAADGRPPLDATGLPGGILVERPARNLGFCASMNRGLELAVADGFYVAFVNADLCVTPDCLARLVEALEADQGAAGAGPLLTTSGGRRIWAAGSYCASGPTRSGMGAHNAPVDRAPTQPARVDFLPGPWPSTGPRISALGGFSTRPTSCPARTSTSEAPPRAARPQPAVAALGPGPSRGTGSSSGRAARCAGFLMGVNTPRFLRRAGSARLWLSFVLFDPLRLRAVPAPVRRAAAAPCAPSSPRDRALARPARARGGTLRRAPVLRGGP
ncbi:MAG: glycosyltransferase [Planctomycetota bacterium]